LGSFNLGTLSSKSCFLLLSFCLRGLLTALLFLFLDFAGLDLLLEGFEARCSCLALLLEFRFLTSSIVPTIISTSSFSVDMYDLLKICSGEDLRLLFF
jgi:hypothetical protein